MAKKSVALEAAYLLTLQHDIPKIRMDIGFTG